MTKKRIPIGIDDFANIIHNNYYYADKTLFIKELLDMKSEVKLFTRPRRFGKTLNMSMIRYFFDQNIEDASALFSGMKIMEEGDEYLNHMSSYPVISIILKSMKQSTYDNAFYAFKDEMAREYKRHDEIVDGLKYESDREKYLRIVNMTAAPEEYLISLKFLSECLHQYYGKKVIILIDEYDVPLENAYFNGFYEEMIALIRSVFESALKSNENLEFSVITGCLRISKESIFTGLNNLEIISILNPRYAEHFGFTQDEVDAMLDYYQLRDKKRLIKEWYDGYKFGDTEVYNPWSVINYVNEVEKNTESLPSPYWSNTSSNSIVRRLIEKADMSAKQEIENLIEGKTIWKPIHEDITYEDVEMTQNNLWNFLFFTGYLKKINEKQDEEIRYIEMAIPNSEVRYIYKRTILTWFEEKVEEKDLSLLYTSILEGSIQNIEEILSENLMETISFYDYQESFYHGFLAGILKNMSNYIVLSNRESGYGRPDIVLKYPSVRGKAVIMELKVSDSYKAMEEKCKEALEQIEKQEYEAQLRDEGYQDIIKYGVTFYRKECRVLRG